MNPNQPYQQQPQQPGVPPQYVGVRPQSPAVPSYASDPGALLQANGTPAVPMQPMAMPQPPAGQAPVAYPQMQAQSQGYPQAQVYPSATPGVAVPQTVAQLQQQQQQAINSAAPPQGANPGVKPVANNPNSTQNMLQIAEIRDGIVIMNDGSYRSVVMVNSINFDLMSRSEQESVEYNYQNFLNSLFFPIQIFIRSQKVDMTPYIEKLDRIRAEHDNMLLSLLMDDYVGYIEALSQQTNIMDKKFYIVIPYFPHVVEQKSFSSSKNFLTGVVALFGNKAEQHVVINEADLTKAKDELRNRVQTVIDGLGQCNIQSLPLDTQELIELYYDTYNPDTATRQQLKNFSDMDTDIVSKGEGLAPQPNLDKELV